jgi:nucleotide-binding universal stress UspA family protein
VFVFKATLGMSSYGNILPKVPDSDLKMPGGLKEDLRDFVRPIFAGSHLVPANRVLVGGSVRERIFEYAQEIKADLVVVGTHGETGLHTRLMGTSVESIVSHATCSVLAVKPVAVATV